MPLIIEIPESEGDFYRMAEIRSLAFGSDHVFIDMLWPRHTTVEGRVLARDRLLKIRNEIHSSRFAVVRDTETGEIVSQAEWHYYPAESKGDVMELDFVEGDEVEKEYTRVIIGNHQAKRREAIANTNVPLMVLDCLATDPKHQRRGFASMLLRCGLEMADAAGGEAYLEASEQGRPVYEKCGFVVMESYPIPVPPKFADRPTIEYYLMRRLVLI